MTYLVVCLFIGLIPAAIAYMKGRSFFIWWVYGAALFLIALIHAIVCEDQARARVCPACAEHVRIAATLCRYCGTALPEIEEPRAATSAPRSSPPKPMTRRTKVTLAAVIAVVLGGWIAAVSTYDQGGRGTSNVSRVAGIPSRHVTRVDFPHDWPLTVDSGVLRCEDDAVTFSVGSRTYALNGTAMTRGLPEIEPIWAWNEESLGSTLPRRKNVSALRLAALDLCD